MKNFDGLKNYCEGEIKVYEERSKMYVPPEVKNNIKINIFILILILGIRSNS